jgi:hypothetical protein
MQEADDASDDPEARGGALSDVGRIGRVITRVRGSSSPGEIVTLSADTREVYIAYATAPIEVGQRVLIIAVRGPRAVEVEPWDHDLP